MEVISKLKNIKKIALVGNSPTLLEYPRGQYIDSFDAVVRMNNYSICPELVDYTGDKTNIYAFTFHNACQWEYRTSDLNICVVNPTGLKNHNYKHVDNLTILNKTETEWNNEFGTQPTTGARILSFLSKFEFDEMYLTGFSYENKNYSHYYNTEKVKNQTGHNLNLELKWLQENRKPYMEFDEHIKNKLR